MVRSFALATAAVGLVAAPVAATAASRPAQPVERSSDLAGQGTIFFLAGIALIALAVVLLPEDQPASP